MVKKQIFLNLGESPSDKSNRQFGFFFSSVFLVLSFIFGLRGEYLASLFVFLIAIFLGASAIFAPMRLTIINRLWTSFGILLGKLTNPLLLLAIFLLVVTPYALILRAFKRDLLRLRGLDSELSYWEERKVFEQDFEWLKRQF
jgi:signal transduction histidine kinase